MDRRRRQRLSALQQQKRSAVVVGGGDMIGGGVGVSVGGRCGARSVCNISCFFGGRSWSKRSKYRARSPEGAAGLFLEGTSSINGRVPGNGVIDRKQSTNNSQCPPFRRGHRPGFGPESLDEAECRKNKQCETSPVWTASNAPICKSI